MHRVPGLPSLILLILWCVLMLLSFLPKLNEVSHAPFSFWVPYWLPTDPPTASPTGCTTYLENFLQVSINRNGNTFLETLNPQWLSILSKLQRKPQLPPEHLSKEANKSQATPTDFLTQTTYINIHRSMIHKHKHMYAYTNTWAHTNIHTDTHTQRHINGHINLYFFTGLPLSHCPVSGFPLESPFIIVFNVKLPQLGNSAEHSSTTQLPQLE